MFYQGTDFQIEETDLGDTWQLEGIIIGNGEHSLGMLLPDGQEGTPLERQTPTTETWETWLKRSDNPVMTIQRLLIR